jgi:hypothetical protein
MARDDKEFEWAIGPDDQAVTDTGDVLVLVTSDDEGVTDEQ